MIIKAQTRYHAEAGTLVLDIDPADLAPRIDPMLIDGERFNPKNELHITVIGRRVAKALDKAGMGKDVVPGLLERLPRSWRVQRLDRWWRVEDPAWRGPDDKEPGGRASIIEEVQCQEGEVFFAALSREIKAALASPPFHITWYFRRDPDGIALPTASLLESLGTRIESMN